MTDEEKAEEYYYKAYPTTLSIGEEERKKKVMDIFLAGLKAGRETEREYVKNNAFTSMKEQGVFPFGKWHDLRKNPKDLPEPHSTVLDENGDKITYRGGDTWTVYSEYYEKGIDAEPPKAWCEVPKFEE